MEKNMIELTKKASLAAVVLLFLIVALSFFKPQALAAPNPFVDLPLSEWNLIEEPPLKGGALSIIQTSSVDGKASTSRYLITLDDAGRFSKSKLVTEGGARSYLARFKRDESGRMLELVQIIRKEGEEDVVNSRQTASYNSAGEIEYIEAQRILTGSFLQPEARVVVSNDGDVRNVSMRTPDSQEMMTLQLGFDPQGLLASVTMSQSGRGRTLSVYRNDEGLISRMVYDVPLSEVSIEYEMDDRGNWIKATATQTMTRPDGREMRREREIVRDISY